MSKCFSLLMVLLLLSFNSTDVVAQEERKVLISTEFGDMTFKLYNDTPLHRDNFVNLVKQGFYNGTIFHRTMPYFMAQGGDPNSKNAPMSQGLGVDRCPTIPAEILPHHFHKKGALSAARITDNQANPNKVSSGCQFFVVQGYKQTDEQINANITVDRNFTYFQRAWYKVRGGSPFLDGEYTVFGEIIDGMEVLDLILAVPTSQDAVTKDRPLADIKMEVRMLN